MTRIVDRTYRGTFRSSITFNGSFRVLAANPALPAITDEVSFGFYAKSPMSPDTLWAAFPSQGFNKLVASDHGVTSQRNGAGGWARGTPFLRVDSGGVSVTLHPTTFPGSICGTSLGWIHHVYTVNRGVARMYLNGLPAATRTYVHAVSGIFAPAADFTFTVGPANGVVGNYHNWALADAAAFIYELTPQEVFDWYTANVLPSRGYYARYVADVWLEGGPVPDSSPNKLNANVITNVVKSGEVPV